MKPWMWILIGALVMIGALLWWMRRKQTTAGSSTGGSSGTRLLLGSADFPLKKGSRGKEVLYVQAFLNTEFKETLTLDGIFGSQTLSAWSRSMAMVWSSNSSNVSQETYQLYIKPRQANLDMYIKTKGITVI